MKTNPNITLADVQNVYNGPEGRLWELIMGQQIHIGGFVSSTDLAQRAGIAEGTKGVDLCCCNGAGMRFLLRFRNVAAMWGVDAAETVIRQAKQRCDTEGFADRTKFVLSDVCSSGIAANFADFVWGEDAWCYVSDKEKLISEAARIVRPGGTIAFTDWVEGPRGLDRAEAKRYMDFMKFPSVQDIDGYKRSLEKNGCRVKIAEDTGRFAPYVELYLAMVGKQLTCDVLKIIGFDSGVLEAIAGEMNFMHSLAKESKIAQGIFVATKK